MAERRMEEVIRTADALVQVEKTVGEFYGSCSEIFTHDSEFWLGLAHDEFLHADVLVKLHENIIREPHKFRSGERFPLALSGLLFPTCTHNLRNSWQAG